MRFLDVPGLHELKNKLAHAIQHGNIAHAQLFLGVEGALGLPLALAYACYIHCQNRGSDDACGACDACYKSRKYIHPDTHFMFPINTAEKSDNEDKNYSEALHSWRDFLNNAPYGKPQDWVAHYSKANKRPIISIEQGKKIMRTLVLKPLESAHKVIIIWQPEAMRMVVANSMLKTLEEPTSNTVFLLVTYQAEKLLPAILSRTQIIQIPLLSDGIIDGYLKDHKEFDDKKRKEALHFARGDLQLALQWSGEDECTDWNQFATWMRACFKKDYKALVNMAEEFHRMTKLQQQQMLYHANDMMRETLLALVGAISISRLGNEAITFIKNFSSVLTLATIEKIEQRISTTLVHLEQNGNDKIAFLHLSLQLSSFIRTNSY